jgi:hypothetical protein
VQPTGYSKFTVGVDCGGEALSEVFGQRAAAWSEMVRH